MQKSFKIFLSFALLFSFLSCEQHFFYLKKVNTNNQTSKIEIQSKNTHRSETPNLTNSFKIQDSNKFTRENVFASSEILNFEFLNSSVDTPKPYTIKKLPAVDEENLKIKNIQNNYSRKEGFHFKILFGILIFLIGFFFLMFGLGSSVTPNTPAFRGCLPYTLIIFGGIMSIVGLILFVIGVNE